MNTIFTLSGISKVSLILLGLAAFSLHAAPSTKKLAMLDRVIASINNEAITSSELNKQTELLLVRLKQSEAPLPPLSVLRKQVLDKMVLEKLQLQLAEEQGIEIDDKAVNKAIEDIANRDGLSVAQMQQFLEEQGIPFPQFRRTIKTEMILSKLHQKEIGQNIIISPKDVDQFLNSPAGQDQTGAEYQVSHILISFPEESSNAEQQKAEAKAEAIVAELKAGADFAKTAMAKSAGQQALNGGDLGWRKIAEMPTLFAKNVSTLHVGEIYGPIRDSSGFHIIKLVNKRSLNTPKTSAQALRAKATEYLYQRKFDEQLVSWLRRLRADAEVEIYLNET